MSGVVVTISASTRQGISIHVNAPASGSLPFVNAHFVGTFNLSEAQQLFDELGRAIAVACALEGIADTLGFYPKFPEDSTP